MTSLNPQLIQDVIKSEGITHFGFAKLGRPLSIAFYRQWLNEGRHGSMEYLARHLPQKENPELLMAKAQSAIVVAMPYLPASPTRPLRNLTVARYAQGEDYHYWLKEKLEGLIEKLKLHLPGETFLAATDSTPILERDLAYQAGLGWFGKNTCLIDQKRGSFFLLGEIITTAVLPYAEAVHPDRCGTCTRCIDACPTQALGPGGLDARKCISYLTIEAKTNPAEELRPGIGENFFGCDICQTVCPWNRHAFTAPETLPLEDIAADLKYVLSASKGELERTLQGTPLTRARGRGLKRNAIVVIVNMKLKHFLPELQSYARNGTQDPQLAELATWAINSLRD